MAALTAWSCRKIGPSFLLCSTLLLTLLHVRSVLAQDGRAVELELVLAVDTSLSINADEYAIQTGGTASFVVIADTFRDYPAAIRRKLQREILAPLPAKPAKTAAPPA